MTVKNAKTTSKTTSTKKAVPANPTQIEWPSDPMGTTSNLKSEGIRTAGKINGQKDKLATFIKTLDILKEHGIARYKTQKETNARTAKSTSNRRREEQRRAEQVRLAKLERAQQEVERLTALAPQDLSNES